MSDPKIIVRRFLSLARATSAEEQNEGPWDKFDANHAIILLGPPGAGKTTVFRETAKSDPLGEYVTVRSFLRRPQSEFSGKVLYLDALDEARPDRSERNKIDRLVEKLCSLDRPRFRLSCREADWFGSSDLRAIQDAIPPTGTLLPLRLEPLNDIEVAALVMAFGAADPPTFIRTAKQKGLNDLLRNPQTLQLLVRSVSVGTKTKWPKTRTTLLKSACEVLVHETNDEHQHDIGSKFRHADLLNAAGRIAAVMLLGGAESVSKQPTEDDSLWLGDFSDQNDLVEAVVQRRIFEIPQGDIVLVHRMVGEYLASRYLAKLTQDGLPIERIVALLTGPDGKPATDLRGLFAAFVTSTPAIATHLLERDPIGVIQYGDPEGLSVDLKRRLLKAIKQLSERDPYFRVDHFDGTSFYSARHTFGSLSTKALVPDLKEMLNAGHAGNHLFSTACDIIEFGPPLPSLAQTLLAIIRDPNPQRPEGQRTAALHAFLTSCPGRQATLHKLLNELGTKHLPESDRGLRGVLLDALYPEYLSAKELTKYLTPDDSNVLGSYTMFLSRSLSERTKEKDIPILLDFVSPKLMNSESHRSDHRNVSTYTQLHDSLFSRALESKILQITGEQFYRWTAPFRSNGVTYTSKKDREKMAEKLEQKKELLISGYEYAINTHPDKFAGLRLFFDLRPRFLNTEIPFEVIELLLNSAVHQQKPEIAKNLFLSACLVARELKVMDGSNLAMFENAVENNATLSEAWRQWRNPKETDADKEYKKFEEETRKIKEQHQKQKDSARIENIKNLTAMRKQIIKGEAFGALGFLAKIYYGLFIDVREGTPLQRLTDEIGADLRDVAIEGFHAILSNPKILSLEEIADTYAKSRGYDVGYAVLAGMDISYANDKYEWKNLSDQTLKVALGFSHANLTMERTGNTERAIRRKWIKELVKERPTLASEVMEQLISSQLKAGNQYAISLNELMSDPDYAEISPGICFRLVGEYPRSHPNALKILLAISLSGSRSDLLRLTAKNLDDWPPGFDEQHALWVTTGFLLEPRKYENEFEQVIESTPTAQWEIAEFITLVEKYASKSLMHAEHYEILVRALGAHFVPAEAPSGGWGGSGHPWDKARYLSELISQLSSDSSKEASDALGRLVVNKKLVPWQNNLKHELAVQIRRRAETNFKRPSPKKVIEALRNGAPANAPDLVALILAQLRELQHELKDGPLDGWKRFWNVEGRHSKLTKPRPEEDCRDHIVELLEMSLRPIGVELSTEARATDKKRIDIKASSIDDCAIPVEVKLQNSSDLWTAPRNQLFSQYMREPQASGKGIYLVIWFGTSVKVKNPSKNLIAKIKSPEMLQNALEEQISKDGLEGILVFVMDLSPPK